MVKHLATISISLVITLASITLFNSYIVLKHGISGQPTNIILAFKEWSLKHKKLYSCPSEQNHRLNNFANSYRIVEKTNKNEKNYKFELNKFSDLSENEFKAMYASYRPSDLSSLQLATGHFDNFQQKPSDSKDWVKEGKASSVKDQGSHCSSSYAFSAINSVESAQKIAGKYSTILSAKEIIDCSGNFGNYGCNGGWPQNALTYIGTYGVDYARNYPYTGLQGTCFPNPGYNKISNFYRIEAGNNSQLLQAVTITPVTASIDITNLRFYKSGIFTGNCLSAVNYSTLIVGYGTVNSVKYWKLQNSLGTSYGMSGYLYIQRFTEIGENSCGLNMFAAYPIL